MRLGPVRVAWLDQPPVGPAHAKMLREQRLTAQRLQGYVTDPPLVDTFHERARVAKPVVCVYTPPTIADLAERPNGHGRLAASGCALALGLLVCLFMVIAWNADWRGGAAAPTPLTQQHQVQGFINTQDHLHDGGFGGAATICVAVAQGQWVEMPVAELDADTLAAIDTYRLPWQEKVGEHC